MSDWYHSIADRHATPGEAPVLAKRVVDRLIAARLIAPTPSVECILGDKLGYPVGPVIKDLYSVDTYPFWKLITSGLEVTTGRWVNTLGLICLDEIHCPNCHTRFTYPTPVWDQLVDAVGHFYEGNDAPTVHCTGCDKHVLAFDWATRPHLGFCYLAFTFWNWPKFDSPDWKIDVPKIVSETLGHPIIVTYGRT